MTTLTAPTRPEVINGLSQEEVRDRQERDQVNDYKPETSRTYGSIIRNNALNLINLILFGIGAVMLAIGQVNDAIISVMIITFNIVMGTVQEIRAKRQLDEIALLNRPKVTVIRSGKERVIDQEELVLDDVVVLSAGDQIVVDGVVLGDQQLLIDESLLTGESDPVNKKAGQELLSGSFCIAGSGLFRVTHVGRDSYANQLTAEARKFRIARTPLQREVSFILRIIMLMAGFIGIMILLGTVISSVPFMRQVQMAAVIAGLIPNGLFLMVILAYAMGAVRIAQRGALVQQSNAVESLSNVTVLCTDKTGTLTANKINYKELYALGAHGEVEIILADYASSVSGGNKTTEAISQALGGNCREPVDEVAFSSALKWSALAFDDRPPHRGGDEPLQKGLHGAYVLGAPEILAPYLEKRRDGCDDGLWAQAEEWTQQGYRVLLFTTNPAVTTLHDEQENPILPPLTPLALIACSDELRPDLAETLQSFLDHGIALKVISGDSPKTVVALARQAGFPGDLSLVSGPDLEQMDDGQFRQAAAETTVFGRITPKQKERLVEVLHEQGNYVAMIGDGVNDVFSLKKADLGIAMQSGSSATRAVADMILLKDSFGSLPHAFTEGQRIVNGMSDIMRIYLTRVFYMALLIIGLGIVGLGFPYVPVHATLVMFTTVAIPTLFLAYWSRPGPIPARGILRDILHFTIPAALTVFLFGFAVYVTVFLLAREQMVDFNVTAEDVATFQTYTNIDYDISDPDSYITEVASLSAQTALTMFSLLAGLLLVVFVEPPSKFFVGGDVLSVDKRPALLAIVILAVLLLIFILEPTRQFFQLVNLPWYAYLFIIAMTVVWALILLMAWRFEWMEKVLEKEFGSR